MAVTGAPSRRRFALPGSRNTTPATPNRNKLANNAKLGMIAYGIIDRDAELTELGRDLLALADREDALYDRLARHILLNLHGMTVVRCIQDMEAAGETVNLTTLRKALAERSIHYPRGGKHPSMMRLWLAKAGVFVGSRWRIDEERVEEILGLKMEQFGELGELTPLQRVFLRALQPVVKVRVAPRVVRRPSSKVL